MIERLEKDLMSATTEAYDTVVIGGGQTGLITGYELKQRGREFVILDAGDRVGDAWRNRWDSLRLFTQAFMNGLPGMKFPGDPGVFVGKEEVADFLETYAENMDLPIRLRTRVTRVSKVNREFRIETNNETYTASNVIVAMADHQEPRVPAFASDLDPNIVQLHSSEYRNPHQLPEGTVLVVGLGNSGADIALDVSRAQRTVVSGQESGALPFRLEGLFGRKIGTRLVRFAMVKVLNTSTPIGRRARPGLMEKGPPLVRVRPKELRAAGVERVGRTVAVENGMPVFADGTTINPAAVIWCTGFRNGFDWIAVRVFDGDGAPIHSRGVTDVPGLYFVGLFFLHAMWSETITGVQPDVRHIVSHIETHRPQTIR